MSEEGDRDEDDVDGERGRDVLGEREAEHELMERRLCSESEYEGDKESPCNPMGKKHSA